MVLLLAGCGVPSASGGPLELAVTTSSASVVSGGHLTFEISLHNAGGTTTYSQSTCGGVAGISIAVPLPLEPAGRTWTGAAGAFKSAVLTSSVIPGLGGNVGPLELEAPPHCSGFGGFGQLDAGATTTSTADWPADYASGIPLIPGTYAWTASVSYDLFTPHNSIAPGIPADINRPYFLQSATRTGSIVVTAGPRSPISLGQVVDAALGNGVFADWIAAGRSNGCDTNAYLTTDPDGYLPSVARWNLEVMCETPRHFARLAIDPFTAAVLGADYCDEPCGR
jgi:hypothetical protein